MNVLRGVIEGAGQDRTKDVIPLRPRQFLDPQGGKMVRAISRGGNPLDRLASRSTPTGVGTIGNELRGLSQEEQMMEGQPLYNNPQVITRDIEPLGPHVDSIDRFELGILHRKEALNLAGAVVRMRDFRTIRDQPCSLITPANYNYEIAQRQFEMFEDEPEKYARMTPQDWWCEEWSVDGIVETCNSHGVSGRGPPEQGVLGERKRATIKSKGPQACYNYWADSGDDLQPGSTLLALIKKVDAPAHYVLNNRYNTATQGYSTQRQLAPVMDQDGAVNFKPFQMCFLALPPDSHYPSMQELEYTDEYGRKRWDTQVIRIGRAHFVPRRVQSTQLVRMGPQHGHSQSSRKLRAYNDANVGIDSQDYTMLHIIMDSDDGICPV